MLMAYSESVVDKKINHQLQEDSKYSQQQVKKAKDKSYELEI